MFKTRLVLKEEDLTLKTRIKLFLEESKYEYIDKPIIYPVKNFFQSIKAVIDYFPLIWKDRDWDHVFFFIMMQFKLKRMREHFEEHDIHTNHMKTAKRIRVCEILLDRLIKDDYWTFQEYCDNPDMETERFKRLSKHENYLKQQDLDMLCKYLSKYVTGWWC